MPWTTLAMFLHSYNCFVLTAPPGTFTITRTPLLSPLSTIEGSHVSPHHDLVGSCAKSNP